MFSTKKIAAGVGLAFAAGYGACAFAIPSPGAVADAYLTVSNFTILQGDGAQGRSNIPLDIGGSIVLLQSNVNTDADVSATLGGVNAQDSTNPVGSAAGFVLTESVGAGFVANTTIPVGTLLPTSFAGSHTSTSGNALDPTPGATPPLPGGLDCGANNQGDCVSVHNQVNLNAGTSGTAQGNQNLTVQFTVEVLDTTLFELAFDADGFLRAALGQEDQSAKATHFWQAKVTRAGQTAAIFQWDPKGLRANGTLINGLDGSCINDDFPETCTEYSAAFRMNDTVALLSTGDDAINNIGSDGTLIPGGGGALFPEFEAELELGRGTYTFTITHTSIADATVSVPEPGTLALLGAGLVGIGARRRKTA